MKGAGDGQNRAITEAMIEQITGQLSQHNAPHCSTEANQAGDSAQDLLGEKVGGQDHDEGGPGLMAEEGQAKERDAPWNRDVWHKDYAGHKRRAQAERNFTRVVHGMVAAQKPTR